MDHRFIGDGDGLRDRRGFLLPVAPTTLCARCGATPDDPECLCTELPVAVVVDATEPEGQAGGNSATPDAPEGADSETHATE